VESSGVLEKIFLEIGIQFIYDGNKLTVLHYDCLQAGRAGPTIINVSHSSNTLTF
jgi:hypothetical protein